MAMLDIRKASISELDRTEESTQAFDVMMLADVCADLTVTGDVRPRFSQVEQFVDDFSIQLGGSGAIFGSQMARLGVRTTLAWWIGSDLFADFVLSELRKAGMDTTRITQHPTVKTCIGLALSETNDRAILNYPGTLDVSSPAELDPGLLACCRNWHIAGYFLMRRIKPAWGSCLALCREAGVTTSLDTNWDPEEHWEGVLELLPMIDVFLPNEAEALAISKQADVLSAVRALARYGPLVVVKRGENGALAVKGEHLWELRASEFEIRSSRIVDTTGAGDNFDAGFLCACLRSAGIDDCLALAHRCAVSSLEHAGGIAGQVCDSRVVSKGK